MSIKVQCPNPACGKVFSVKAEYAGRKAKCPGCSSPLIIPTPDAGAFDFGSLGGGPAAAPAEPENPFAFEAAPPAPKSKPVKKPAPPPAPEPANPFTAAAPPPAGPRAVAPPPPPVAEPITASLAEEPEAVVVAVPPSEPVGPTPEAGDFSSIVEAGPSGPHLPPEPWFYGFISGYAKVLMFLGVLAAVFILLSAIVGVFMLYEFYGPVMTIVMVISVLFWVAIFLLGIFLTGAFMLLTVDAARNLREVRKLLSRD